MSHFLKLKFNVLIVLLFISTIPSFSQNTVNFQEKQTSYDEIIRQRVAKIVINLNIEDSLKAKRVADIIANQYHQLSEIHDTRNARVKTLKADTTKSKAEKDTLVKREDVGRDAKISKLHSEYLSKLSEELTSAQIDKVKDGMTSGKVEFTYGGYIQMIPALTDLQKKQILDWLIEAREIAMDAESSEKKTAVFGKFKGRIANYLSAQGYDLKKEGEAWQKRRDIESKK